MKFILLLRFSILVSFNITNYILGGSSVSVLAYCVGTVGVMPQVLFYVYMGSTMSSIQDAISGEETLGTPQIVAMAVSTVGAVTGSTYISVVVKKKIKEEEVQM